MDGKRAKDGLITLDQDLFKHHVLVRTGQPLQEGKVKKSQSKNPVQYDAFGYVK